METRQGSVVTIDLEALTCEKERIMSADTTAAGMSMHPPNGRPRATRVYLRNRLLWRERERRTHDCIRERRYMTSLLETLVSPTSGGTKSCTGVSRVRSHNTPMLCSTCSHHFESLFLATL